MSDPPKNPPKRSVSSDQHVAVKTMRAKFDSIQEGTLAATKALNARTEALQTRTASSPPDPIVIPDDVETVPDLTMIDEGDEAVLSVPAEDEHKKEP